MSLTNIDISIIPHEQQRYETCGDWQFENYLDFSVTPVETRNGLCLNISDTGNEDSNFLIAIHELIEAYLCKKAGITEQQVDDWDMSHLDSDDPGGILGCPYHLQHDFAEDVEMKVANELGLDWKEHEANIQKLGEKE